MARLGLSHIHKHKFRHYFQDSLNPLCDYGKDITALKLSVFGVFLVRIFPHLNCIRRFTPQISVFCPNAGKRGNTNQQIQTLFKQCIDPKVHFFLHCINLPIPKQTLFQKIKNTTDNILSQCETQLMQTLLYGNQNHNSSIDRLIIHSAIEYLFSSERFKCSLLN